MTRLYLAYGSNLCRSQMARRCPLAYPLTRVIVRGWRLAFRGYADIEEVPGATLPAAVYRLTPRCEASLDLFEGVAKGSYSRAFLDINSKTLGRVSVLTYVKRPGALELPSSLYLSTVASGYRQWNLPLAGLRAAVERAARSAIDDAPDIGVVDDDDDAPLFARGAA